MSNFDPANAVTCPICSGRFDAYCWERYTSRDARAFECETCGSFEISRSAFSDAFEHDRLSELERAILSHKVRNAQKRDHRPIVMSAMVEGLRLERLPSPSQQVTNLLQLMGDELQASGLAFSQNEATGAIIGLSSKDARARLFDALEGKGLIRKVSRRDRRRLHGGTVNEFTWDMTLDGWDRYEAQRHGERGGDYGFIAMKFNDPQLDRFVSEVLKPGLARHLEFRVVDLRDVSQAGVIDNIMRAQIRDAAFVIVDLTHDNSGAYWEAGYAEGLGKPVIYICEQGKFAIAKTHFDTNHCTTVPWTENEPEQFVQELVATLRRSLNLFSNARVS